MKKNVSFDPGDVGLFGAQAEVAKARYITDLIEEFSIRFCGSVHNIDAYYRPWEYYGGRIIPQIAGLSLMNNN